MKLIILVLILLHSTKIYSQTGDSLKIRYGVAFSSYVTSGLSAATLSGEVRYKRNVFYAGFGYGEKPTGFILGYEFYPYHQKQLLNFYMKANFLTHISIHDSEYYVAKTDSLGITTNHFNHQINSIYHYAGYVGYGVLFGKRFYGKTSVALGYQFQKYRNYSSYLGYDRRNKESAFTTLFDLGIGYRF